MHVALVGPELEENLSLRYLRGALEAEGHRVTQVDFASPREIDRAAAEIARSGAQIVGLSMVFTRRAREFADLAKRARELGFRGLTVAGGHFAAFHAEQLLADVPSIDVIAIGEGERILCDLARGERSLAEIAGLVFRENQTVRRTEPREPVQNLDEIAWPPHRRPYDRYLGLPIVNMLGSRGCTHSCGFCSIAAWHKLCGGERYRQRSAANIAAEMGCMWRDGVRLFNFHDDNFLGRNREENLARAHALRDELRKQGVGKLAFQIKARPDEIDQELFAFLRSMGLFRVFLGIEAGTEASLHHLGRGQKLRDNERALEILNGLDVHVAFNLLVLNPESTFDDFVGNVAFLRKHLVNPMNFCRTEIYEGTPLARRLRKRGRLLGDYWGLDYEIDDLRAQRAFELFRDAFFDRNFGAHPLHYLSGQVDYEHQLRMDFHGTTPPVRAAAKGFVRAVNENTVSYLEEVLEQVREGKGDDAFAQDLFERVAKDDVRLHEEGQAVLVRIREIPERTQKARPRSPVAIAAAAALALAGCPNKETAPMEAAPPPPPTSTGGPPQPDATVEEVPPQVMEAAPYWPPQTPDASVIGDARADATQDAKPDTKTYTKADTGTKTYPTVTVTAPMEAAPPPPHHMEAAPNWKKNNP